MDQSLQSSQARYSIGIDLGTTHCALSYVDRQASDGEKVEQGVLDIPQLTGPSSVEARPLLPSFLYLPHESELTAADMALPWGASQDFVVGEFARSRGAATPIRLVSSAKSWLCHAGVDRRAAILPADAPPEGQPRDKPPADSDEGAASSPPPSSSSDGTRLNSVPSSGGFSARAMLPFSVSKVTAFTRAGEERERRRTAAGGGNGVVFGGRHIPTYKMRKMI